MPKNFPPLPELLQTVYVIHGETLAPVHIGDGRELEKERDFLAGGAEIHIFNALAALEKKYQGMPELPDFGEDFRLSSYFNLPEDAPFHEYSLKLSHDPNRIRTVIKNSQAKPYIPGSSLKGALRTAFLCGVMRFRREQALDRGENVTIWLQDQLGELRLRNGKPKRRDAADFMAGKIFGKTANFDIFRHFLVRDSQSLSLPISGIKAELFKAENDALVSVGRELDLTYEAIPIGAQFQAELVLQERQIDMPGAAPESLDHQSLKNWLARQETKLRRHFLDNCRDGVNELLQREYDFYQNRHEQLRDFYKGLQEQAKTLQRDRALLLPLGWGAGWRSKTLAMLDLGEDEKWLRQELNLKPEQETYPETRKIITSLEKPLPLGWVKLTFERVREVVIQKHRVQIHSLTQK